MSAAPNFFQDEPATIDPLQFSPETQALLELLGEDDDERPVSFTEAQKKVEVREVQDDAPADEVQDVGEGTSSPADWSAVSPRQARQFIAANPDAKIEIIFPSVFEEDRHAKIADLDQAHSVKAISYQQMAEQMAQELGFSDYNYDDAQQQIADEQPTFRGRLGSGDGLAGQVGDARRGPADSLDRNTLRDQRPPAEELSNLRRDERSFLSERIANLARTRPGPGGAEETGHEEEAEEDVNDEVINRETGQPCDWRYPSAVLRVDFERDLSRLRRRGRMQRAIRRVDRLLNETVTGTDPRRGQGRGARAG